MKTVSYEKVVFQCLSKAFEIHEESPLYTDVPKPVGGYEVLDEVGVLDTYSDGFDFYRKIETEITPIQAAKDACKNFVNNSLEIDPCSDFDDFIRVKKGSSFDETFVEACRVIVNAYDAV